MKSDGRHKADETAAAEQAPYRAMLAHDFDALRSLLADDLVYIHSTGIAESKEAYLAGLAAGLYEYGKIDSRQVKCWGGGEVAVQTGNVDMSVGERGAPKQRLSLLFTLAWRREDGNWRLALRQLTTHRHCASCRASCRASLPTSIPHAIVCLITRPCGTYNQMEFWPACNIALRRRLPVLVVLGLNGPPLTQPQYCLE
ncbi:MAG: nuclear transport factor 2 family protein [Hyphomicrobiales bacterium]